MTEVTYRKELITLEFRTEVRGLLADHYREVGLNQHLAPLDPDWDTYGNLERNGQCHVLTARADGKLIGYSCYLLLRNLHYQSVLCATADVFFIHPDFRKGAVGFTLFVKSEQMLRELRVARVDSRVKLHNGLDAAPRKILERLGYKPIELNFSKMLVAS